jgi:hypothetical protein
MTGLDAAGLTATFSVEDPGSAAYRADRVVLSVSLSEGINRQNRHENFLETLFGALLATVLGR